MTNLPPLHQALHDADDKEIVDALRYLGRAERIAAALNAQAGVVEALRPLEEKLETYQQSCWTLTDSLMAIELAEAARAAIAAVKGVES